MQAPRHVPRFLIVLLLSLAAHGLAGATLAQGVTFACEDVAAPAASGTASAEASPVAADAVVFPESGELTVYAAASLTDVFGQIGDDITAQYPGIEITFNFAGSQELVTQLSQGAEADVFASANTAQMTAATDAGVVDTEAETFTRNRLAIVVPADNPAGIETPADLGNEGVLLVLAQPEVPVGRYSGEVVCLMAADTATYGDGFAERVGANVVSQETDVREVLTKVQLGEADAGIVYVSDVTEDVAGDVEIIELPDEANVIATYPIAPVVGGDVELAEAFIAYVLSPEGQATLDDYGFTPLP